MRLLCGALWLLSLLPLAAAEPDAPAEPIVPPAESAPAESAPADEPPVGATARFRLLHAIPRGAALTIFVDGAEHTPALGYGTLTDYQAIVAGVHGFGVVSDDEAVLSDAEATLATGSDYTIALLGDDRRPRFLLITDHEPAARGDDTGRVRATNLVADAGFVFSVEDRLLAALLKTGQSTPEIKTGLGDHTFHLNAAAPGGAEFALGPASVPDRTTYSYYVIGLAGAEDPAAVRVIEDLQPWAESPTVEQPPSSVTRPPNTRLRVLHLAGGAEALSGTLDGKPLFAKLAFGDLTPYLPQLPGTHDLSLDGDQAFVNREPLSLAPEQAHTLVILREQGRLRYWLLTDAPQQVERPCLRVVHVAWRAPDLAVDQFGGETLVGQVSYMSYEGYLPLGELSLGQQLELGLRPVGQSTVVQAARVSIAPDGAYTLYLADSGTDDPRAVRLKLVKDGGS